MCMNDIGILEQVWQRNISMVRGLEEMSAERRLEEQDLFSFAEDLLLVMTT